MKVLIGMTTTKISLTWSPSLVKRWHGALNVFSTTLTLTNFPGCLSTSVRCRRWGFTHTTTTVLSRRFRRFSVAPTSLVWLTYLWWARRVNTRDFWISIKAPRWSVAKSITVVTYLFFVRFSYYTNLYSRCWLRTTCIWTYWQIFYGATIL